MNQFRKTKIVATLGPSSSSEVMIKKLALAGANVFRLNFSHGTCEVHKQNAKIIRKIEEEIGLPIGIMMDIQGPKIRIGMFEDGSVLLEQGAKFIFDLDTKFGNLKRVSLPHPEIFAVLEPGNDLLLDDGKIKLRILNKDEKMIETKVIDGGVLSNRKGLNIPNVLLPLDVFTEKDKKDIAVIDEIDADWLAVSFVQTVNDVLYAKKSLTYKVPIVAKIEKPLAVQHIDSILKESDAIMIARGDLGVELPYESIPGIQKELINKARFHRKPVIVATQMLESMTSCYIPTRAEVSDVAFAVASGADALMLSAESASGDFPEESVKTMVKVIEKTEKDNLDFFDKNFENLTAISESVEKSVKIEKMKMVAVFVKSEGDIIDISNARPKADIIAFIQSLRTMRRLCLVWGVRSILINEGLDFLQIGQIVAQKSFGEKCKINSGDKIAIVSEIPFGRSGKSNMLHIYEVDQNSPL
ncbi:MAG: pyruvate kinase [Holosporales bacterium]|jgi:pyruvate kinase|nr:pyruvate kinase [Holosporales bacterium]